MKKNWFFLLLAIIAIIITTQNREKHVNHFDFPKTLKASNSTEYRRVDTMAMIVLNKIMLFDTLEVNIYYMTGEITNNNIDVQAFVQKNPFIPHSYYLFIKKGTLSTPIDKIISHEMIHVKQMETGIFKQINADEYIYNGKTFFFSKVPYDQRPQEINAFKNENSVLQELNNLLYKK